MMAYLIYGLCALLSLATAVLLWRHHRRQPSRLVFWAACCFTGLALSNVVLILDKIMIPETDLAVVRHAIALVSILVLLYGMIDAEE